MRIATKADEGSNQSSTTISASFYKNINFYNLACLLLITIGIYYRELKLFESRELWRDEISSSINIIKLELNNILMPMNASIGFLLLQKFFLVLFGFNDMVFRITPLIFGIASIVAMRELCQRLLSQQVSIAVLVIFVLSGHLIYYSNEAKQYSQDVFFSISLLLLALRKGPFSTKENIFSAFLVLLALLFSHPALFVIGSLILYRVLLKPSDYKIMLGFLALTLGTLIFLYFASYRPLINKPYMQSYWDFAFPKGSWSEQFIWLGHMLKTLSETSLPKISIWITATLTIVGTLYWSVKDIKIIILLLTPFFLNIGAAYLRCYPFSGERLSLFLVPQVLVIAAGSIEAIRYLLRKHSCISGAICSALICALIFQQHWAFRNSVFESRYTQSAKDLMQQLSIFLQPGDFLIADNPSSSYFKFHFDYYSKLFLKENLTYCNIRTESCEVKLHKTAESPNIKNLWIMKINPSWENSLPYTNALKNCLENDVDTVDPLIFGNSKATLINLGLVTKTSKGPILRCLYKTNSISTFVTKKNL